MPMLKVFGDLCEKHGIREDQVTVKKDARSRNFGVFCCKVSNKQMLEVLKKVAWVTTDSPIKAEINFLGRESPADSWIIVAPQIADSEAIHFR
jgi:hypothetical protein